MPFGTLVNTLTVIFGSAIGLLLHHRMPENIKKISFQGLGLCTLLLGVQMGLKSDNFIILIGSVLIGGIVGESLHLEDRMNWLGEKMKQAMRSSNERFTEGLVTAFILFCVGSLTVLGALEEGLRNNPTLILTKATLDGFAAVVLSSVYGIGVMVSALPLLIFQSAITLSAGLLQPFLPDPVLDQISATGGALIIGIGINLLDVKKLKIINFLPALVVVVIIQYLYLLYVGS